MQPRFQRAWVALSEWVVGQGISIAFTSRGMAIHRHITGYDRCIPHHPTWKPHPQVPLPASELGGIAGMVYINTCRPS